MLSISDEACDTSEFIEKFDQLFNTFNSRTLSSPAYMRYAFSDSSGHIPFLQEKVRREHSAILWIAKQEMMNAHEHSKTFFVLLFLFQFCF